MKFSSTTITTTTAWREWGRDHHQRNGRVVDGSSSACWNSCTCLSCHQLNHRPLLISEKDHHWGRTWDRSFSDAKCKRIGTDLDNLPNMFLVDHFRNVLKALRMINYLHHRNLLYEWFPDISWAWDNQTMFSCIDQTWPKCGWLI